MFIETHDTPNPNTVKFVPGVRIIESGIKSYTSAADCKSSPLAANLFKISDVTGVFLTPDFITVTKSDSSNWSYLRTIVLACILDHFTAGLPAYINDEKPPTQHDPDQDATIAQIKELIESKVKPAVMQDGGDITFQDYKNNIVYVELHGSCSGCPSSTITLKSGIERMLKFHIPEIISVESV